MADLQPNTAYERCVLNVPMLIQANRGGRWVTLVSVRTASHGNHTGAAQGHGQLPSGGPGLYRAVAPGIRFGNQTCAETDRTFPTALTISPS